MKNLEEMEKKTYDNFRGLGCTKGESMKAVNKLRGTLDGARSVFQEKFEKNNGSSPAKESGDLY